MLPLIAVGLFSSIGSSLITYYYCNENTLKEENSKNSEKNRELLPFILNQEIKEEKEKFQASLNEITSKPLLRHIDKPKLGNRRRPLSISTDRGEFILEDLLESEMLRKFKALNNFENLETINEETSILQNIDDL